MCEIKKLLHIETILFHTYNHGPLATALYKPVDASARVQRDFNTVGSTHSVRCRHYAPDYVTLWSIRIFWASYDLVGLVWDG